jgi:hypothetical protein
MLHETCASHSRVLIGWGKIMQPLSHFYVQLFKGLYFSL